jgi:2-keto-4-pentenoate hydratase/2-oxohepta-3-ene-1,7-dioic acid hydratase in catechol pathway
VLGQCGYAASERQQADRQKEQRGIRFIAHGRIESNPRAKEVPQLGEPSSAIDRAAAAGYAFRQPRPTKTQGAVMKLAFFDDFKFGVVTGDKIVDVTDVVSGIPHLGPQDIIRGVIERFGEFKGKLADAAAKGQGKPVSQVRFRPPLPKPENIICMAVNYMEDGTLPEPAPINAFMKSPSAIIGDGDTMVLPDMAASVFEGEAEIAVVIGKRATHVKAADAMSYVFGYTNFIDGSARGVVPPTNVFYQMKSRDTFAPIGPYIVTADEIKDPHKLQVKLTNNGVVYQSFNTDDMAHKIPRCIEWVTSIHTLEPGDILATGTNHRGLNPFMDGDKIELTCEGCGTLHITVRDDQHRTWARITRLQHKQSGAEGVHTKQTGGKYAK